MRVAQALLIGAVVVLAVPAGSSAQAPIELPDPLPLDAISRIGDERVGFPMYSSDTYSTPGAMVAAVGDVNGDGVEDTAATFDSFEPSYPESVWVTFSAPVLPLTLEAGEPPWRGLRITGADLQFGLQGMGDLNGDGLDDVALFADSDVVVVFGKREGGTVDLSNLGDQGFRISTGLLCSAGGGGTSARGVLYANNALTPLGDQNGDGVNEIAFCAGDEVRVIFTPSDPAGLTISAGAPPAGGFILVPPDPHTEAIPGRLGDINGDGREDLAVVWMERGGPDFGAPFTVHTAGVVSPPSGSTVDLSQVAEDDQGFELHAPDSYLENALTIGDQNGDGIREVAWVAFGVETYRQRTLAMIYSPPLGTEKVAYPVDPALGEEISVYGGDVSDVGDQDGDGKADIAHDNVIWLSGGTRRVGPPGEPDELGGRMIIAGEYMIADSVADRNLDGKRELVAVHAEPYADEPGDHRAKYYLDTFLSAPLPLPEAPEPPVIVDDELEFPATFETTRVEGSRTLAGRPFVELRGPSGTHALVPGDVYDTNRKLTDVRVSVPAAAAGLARGCSYQYRVLLDNSRGIVGASDWARFSYGNGTACNSGQAPDRRAPNTSIQRGPKKHTESARATFRFEASESATFACRLDRKRWRPCDSPRRYKQLRPGRHRFLVRATDPAGNVEKKPASATWRIDRG